MQTVQQQSMACQQAARSQQCPPTSERYAPPREMDMPAFTRREIMAGGGAAVVLAKTAVAAPQGKVLGLPPGVQLWAVKDDMARDVDGTLRRLANIGYRRVEAAGWAGRTPAGFRAAVISAGLEPFSCHFSMRDLIDDFETELAQARDVGARYVVASSPASARALDGAKPWNVGLAEAMTLADWRRNADAMNRIGARAKAMGMRFGYHNHAAEMLRYDGVVALDELMRLTDPALVHLELDLGWVAAAGHDPAAAIRRHARRIELLHVKDVATRARVPGRIADDLNTTAVGAGTIDWRATFAAAERAPVAGWFVEQEPPFTQPPLEAMTQSLAFLTKLKG
jgi:sugar phosphate isomerase/epimerase